MWPQNEGIVVVPLEGLKGKSLSAFISTAVKAVSQPKKVVTRKVTRKVTSNDKLTKEHVTSTDLKIKTRALQLRESGLSFKEVAEQLKAEGYKTSKSAVHRTLTGRK